MHKVVNVLYALYTPITAAFQGCWCCYILAATGLYFLRYVNRIVTMVEHIHTLGNSLQCHSNLPLWKDIPASETDNTTVYRFSNNVTVSV